MKLLSTQHLGRILLGVLVFGQILLIGQQIRTDTGESRLRFWSSGLLAPVQKAAGAVSGVVADGWNRYLWLMDADRDNRRLDSEAERLRIENHFLRQRLRRFEKQVDLEIFSETLASRTVAASVIAHGPSRSAQQILLNRGGKHGVEPGMAVITSLGIVGKVEAAYAGSSVVLLISDSEAGAGVFLAESGESGVLRGTNRRDCRLLYVGPQVRVAEGETVYTSGFDGVFPRGLPVGRVTSVREGVETQTIAVDPFVELGQVSEVLVVVEGEHEALPESVRARLRATGPAGPAGSVSVPRDFAPTDADRIKGTYRSAVEGQGKRIGLLMGAGPADLGAASDALRTARPPPLERTR